MRRSLLYSLAVVFAVVKVAQSAPTKECVPAVNEATVTCNSSFLDGIKSLFNGNKSAEDNEPKPSKEDIRILSEMLEYFTDPNEERNPFPKEVRERLQSKLIMSKLDKIIWATQKKAAALERTEDWNYYKETLDRTEFIRALITKDKRMTKPVVQKLFRVLWKASLEDVELRWIRKQVKSDVSGPRTLSALFALYLEKMERDPESKLSETMQRLFNDNEDIVRKFKESDPEDRIELLQGWMSKVPKTEFAVELWQTLDESEQEWFRKTMEVGPSKVPKTVELWETMEQWEQELSSLIELEDEVQPQLESLENVPKKVELWELLDESEQEST